MPGYLFHFHRNFLEENLDCLAAHLPESTPGNSCHAFLRQASIQFLSPILAIRDKRLCFVPFAGTSEPISQVLGG